MKKSFWLPIALGLMAYLVLPMPGMGAPLSDRINEKQHEIDAAKQKEGVLTTTIQGFSSRIAGLQGQIHSTQRQLDTTYASCPDPNAPIKGSFRTVSTSSKGTVRVVSNGPDADHLFGL